MYRGGIPELAWDLPRSGVSVILQYASRYENAVDASIQKLYLLDYIYGMEVV